MKQLALIAFFLVATGAISFGTDATTSSTSTNLRQAIHAVRLINTAQARVKLANRHFLQLSELLSSGALEEASKNNEIFGAAYQSLNVKNQKELLRGFDFTMVVAPDGSAYKLSLTEKNDCGVAIFTDDRGLIYQGKALGCADKQ